MIWKLLTALLVMAVLALGVPAVRHLREVPPPPLPVVRAQLPLPPGVTLGAGTESLDAAISPDEQSIVFVAAREGTAQLWLQSLSTGTAQPLEGTVGASLPAWKRDGSAVAYFSGGKLRVFTIGSGADVPLIDAPTPAGVTWLADGALLYGGDADGVIRKLVNGTAEDVTRLAEGDIAHAFPSADESGRLVYIAVRQNGTRVVRLMADGQTTDLTETAGHAVLQGDVLVHVRDNVLLAQRLDDSGPRLVGRSVSLATGVGRSERGHGYFATARRIALWAPALPRASELAWFDATGRREATVTEPGDYWQVRLSPDGRDVAVTALDPLLRTLDVMVIPLSAPGSARRVSLAIGPDTDPVWSPDGRTVAFRSAQSGAGAIVARPSAQSSAPETTVLRRDVDLTPSDWRGDTILLHRPGEGGTRTLTAFDRRQGTETTLSRPGFNSSNARWSPNGRWIAYVSDESGQSEVYVQPWPGGLPRIRATFGGGQRPQWGRDGAFYFIRNNAVMRATLVEGQTPTVSTPQTVLVAQGLRDFAVSQTTDRFLVVGATPGTQVPQAFMIFEWLTTVPPAPQPPPRL